MGKIISVVGGPGCGKSYLCKKIAPIIGADLILEGEEKDFPNEIVQYLKDLSNNRELFVWFRNKLIKEMFGAKELSIKGNVIMDGFRMTNLCYIDSFFNGFGKSLAEELMSIDEALLTYPDIVILLESNEEFIRSAIKKRNRTFEIGNIDEKVSYFLQLQSKFKEVFSSSNKFTLLHIDRSDMDFDNTEDIDRILKLIT